MKRDYLMKKSIFVFWPSQKNVTKPFCQKCPKNSILAKIAFFNLTRKPKLIFFPKKSFFVFWPSQKNVTEPNCQKWAKNSISPRIAISLTLTCLINRQGLIKGQVCSFSKIYQMGRVATCLIN